MNFEDIQTEVISRLRLVRKETLRKCCTEVNLEIPEDKADRFNIIKMLMKYLFSDAMDNLEDQGASFFWPCIPFFKRI